MKNYFVVRNTSRSLYVDDPLDQFIFITTLEWGKILAATSAISLEDANRLVRIYPQSKIDKLHEVKIDSNEGVKRLLKKYNILHGLRK